MRCSTAVAGWIVAVSIGAVAVFGQTRGPSTAVFFEGGRLIVGDGTAAIERSAFIVEHGAFVRVGRQGQLTPPAGASRVDLAGKTVMPAIIDTHNHLSQTREMLLDDLRRRAYFGIGAYTCAILMKTHGVPFALAFAAAGAAARASRRRGSGSSGSCR